MNADIFYEWSSRGRIIFQNFSIVNQPTLNGNLAYYFEKMTFQPNLPELNSLNIFLLSWQNFL